MRDELPPRKNAPRKLTDEQVQTRDALTRWWIDEAYPQRHGGVVYEFDGGRDAKAVLKLLSTGYVAWDMERAQAVCAVYLDAPPSSVSRQGRPIYGITESGGTLNHWLTQATYVATGRAPTGTNHGRTRPPAAQRGEHPETIIVPDYVPRARRGGADPAGGSAKDTGDRRPAA